MACYRKRWDRGPRIVYLTSYLIQPGGGNIVTREGNVLLVVGRLVASIFIMGRQGDSAPPPPHVPISPAVCNDRKQSLFVPLYCDRPVMTHARYIVDILVDGMTREERVDDPQLVASFDYDIASGMRSLLS